MKDTNVVNLNHETCEMLQRVRKELSHSLGFEPTNGQVVRHLISIYFKETKSA